MLPTYKRFISINGLFLLAIALIILIASISNDSYFGIICFFLITLLLLIYGIVNFILLLKILKSDDAYRTEKYPYLITSLFYLGLFAWFFMQMQGFHPTTSP